MNYFWSFLTWKEAFESFYIVDANSDDPWADAAASASHTSFKLYGLFGLVATLLYFILLGWYMLRVSIKIHSIATMIFYHSFCNAMVTLGLFANYAIQPTLHHNLVEVHEMCMFFSLYNQFFFLAGTLWYFVVSLDLLLALINPWCKTSSKTLCYHTWIWLLAALSTAYLWYSQGYGLSSLNICWIRRTENEFDINPLNWELLFCPIILVFAVSVVIQIAAAIRMLRRQRDLTHRAKTRLLGQCLRYLLLYGMYWSVCAALYYLDYAHSFNLAKIQVIFAVLFALYPLLLLVIWSAHSDLVEQISNFGHERDSRNAAPGGNSYEESIHHFSDMLRKDLMYATTLGIIKSVQEEGRMPPNSPEITTPQDAAYQEKIRRNVVNQRHRFYEKLGFTDYAPRVFREIRQLCSINETDYMNSFRTEEKELLASALIERSSEGKSGMVFYFTKDHQYLVKTMTKQEHDFLLHILPTYHQYLKLNQSSLLCRFLGCHSMQLPIGWNRMFFIVMKNVLFVKDLKHRYDIKGMLEPRGRSPVDSLSQGLQRLQDTTRLNILEESKENDLNVSRNGRRKPSDAGWNPLRYISTSSIFTSPFSPSSSISSSAALGYDLEFMADQIHFDIAPEERVHLLTQMTKDCNFLQDLHVLDYSCLIGINQPKMTKTGQTIKLGSNSFLSKDKRFIYSFGFVDILQHYTMGWKLQNCFLRIIKDKRKITALPPPEYAMRFLNFAHRCLLFDPNATQTKQTTYGSFASTDL